jgi:DNA-binding MarR family transcriptional regulator
MARNSDLTIAGDIRDHCLARRARLLGRRVTRIYDDALRPVGLTSGQLTILVAVTLYPGALASQLHDRLDLEQSSFSRNAAIMQRQGWIEKRTIEGERGQGLHITRQGSALLAEALPCWRSAQREAKRMLGDDSQTFLDLVDEHVTPG